MIDIVTYVHFTFWQAERGSSRVVTAITEYPCEAM